MLFLCETKLVNQSCDRLQVRLGMESGFSVGRVGLGGRITLLWKEVNLEIKSCWIGHIDTIVESAGVQGKWRFTGSMAIQTQRNARTQWELRQLANQLDLLVFIRLLHLQIFLKILPSGFAMVLVRKGRLSFQAMWLRAEDCEKLIEKSWSRILRRLKGRFVEVWF